MFVGESKWHEFITVFSGTSFASPQGAGAVAVLAEAFLEHCDGFSIGSNDLTQLALGVDRDSGLLTGYDERNEAVTALMEMAIKACKKAGQVKP